MMWRLTFTSVFVLLLIGGCGPVSGGDEDWYPPEAFTGPDGDARRVAFEQEFAQATARHDYTGMDPYEVTHGRALRPAQCDGWRFLRRIIDGREATTDSHEALAPGRRLTGRTHKLPSFRDPRGRFVVMRSIVKIEDRWEMVTEEWVLFPPGEDCTRYLSSVTDAAEVAGGEDLLGHPSTGRGVGIKGFQPRGFKTRIPPSGSGGTGDVGQAGQAGKTGKTGKTGRAGSAGTPSSTSKPKTAARKSGLSVVARPDMKARTVTDANGHHVTIYGQTRSSSTTPGHDTTMEAQALKMARSGDYEYVTIQRSWRTATGRVSEHRNIPDIIGVRRDGKVDAVEVVSATDKLQELQLRLDQGMASLPRQHQGKFWMVNSSSGR